MKIRHVLIMTVVFLSWAFSDIVPWKQWYSNPYSDIVCPADEPVRFISPPESLNTTFVSLCLAPCSRKTAYCEIDGNRYLFVYMTGSILILDVNDPTNPQQVIEIGNPGEPGGGWIGGLAIADTFLYVAASSAGLWIYNVANPYLPVHVGTCITGNTCGIFVTGDYAYVADIDNGLIILDISDPTAPQEVGFLQVPGELEMAADVVVSDTLAYVAAFRKLAIVNVANPSMPSLVSTFDPPPSYGGMTIIQVDYQDGFVYFVNTGYPQPISGDEGYWIVDVRNPQIPVAAYHIFCGIALDIAVDGDYAYGATEAVGLVIFNTADPYHAYIVDTFNTSGCASGVFVSNNYVYVADFYSTLIVDASDPGNSALIGSYDNYLDMPRDIVIKGNYAYVLCCYSALRVVDISNPYYPVEIGCLDNIDYTWAIEVIDTLAYECVEGAGFRTINVANPASPFEVGLYDPPGNSYYSMVIDGSYAYIANGSGLQVLDISNPTAPESIGSWCPMPYIGAFYITKSGSYIYLMCIMLSPYAGINVIDVSDPSVPCEIGHWQLNNSSNLTSIEVSGDYLYVVATENFYILDISDPASPAVLDSFEDICLGYGAGLCITQLGNKKYALIGSSNSTTGPIVILDVTDPLSISLAGYYYQHHCVGGGAFFQTANVGDTIYVTTDLGLEVFRFTGATGVTEADLAQYYNNPTPILKISPNPFRGTVNLKFQILPAHSREFSAERESAFRDTQSGTSTKSQGEKAGSEKMVASLKIYDATGRLVKNFSHLTNQPFNRITWQGDDDLGRKLPAGIYFVRLSDGSYKETAKVMLVR